MNACGVQEKVRWLVLLGEYGQSVVSCKDFSVCDIHHRTAVNELVSQLVEEYLEYGIYDSLGLACLSYIQPKRHDDHHEHRSREHRFEMRTLFIPLLSTYLSLCKYVTELRVGYTAKVFR